MTEAVNAWSSDLLARCHSHMILLLLSDQSNQFPQENLGIEKQRFAVSMGNITKSREREAHRSAVGGAASTGASVRSSVR